MVPTDPVDRLNGSERSAKPHPRKCGSTEDPGGLSEFGTSPACVPRLAFFKLTNEQSEERRKRLARPVSIHAAQPTPELGEGPSVREASRAALRANGPIGTGNNLHDITSGKRSQTLCLELRAGRSRLLFQSRENSRREPEFQLGCKFLNAC